MRKSVGNLTVCGLFGLCLGSVISSSISAAEPALGSPAQIEHFERHVRPLLIANCWSCHGEKKQEGGLRLDTRSALLKGGDNGPAVVPGDLAGSRLIQAVHYRGDSHMPPSGPLKSDAIAALERWVTDGVAWPSTSVTSADAWKLHWAFQPIRRSIPSQDLQDQWSRSPLDRLLVEGLTAQKLTPSPAADRRTLIRRVSFDLLGLPPTPEAITEFEADDGPDAWERLIDRLLANPRYGERWGRHWLDVARYSDTKGYVFFEDREFPWGYTYRDYVIEALNADLPYDQFLLEQLAADQLQTQGDAKPLRALGYLTLGPRFMNNVHDIMDDRIDVVTRGVMGLTVTCARCHDHKYDPISQADYYALYGVFRSSAEPLIPPVFSPAADTDEARTFAAELLKRTQPLDEFIDRKHSALVIGSRTRVDEYLLAARQAMLAPPTDDFMLISDPGEINPALILRWKAYLEKAAEQPHPVWQPWSLLAKIPDAQFAEQSPAVIQQLTASGTLNPRIMQEILNPPPQSLGEVAARYGALFKSIYQTWETELALAEEAGRPAAIALPDPALEQIRQEIYGSQSPASLPRVLGWGFLTLLPDRASQGEFQKLLKEVETWLKTAPGAPPRAMVLQDAELFGPRIFERGNPNRPGATVQRRFLSALDAAQQPFPHGSGRLDLARKVVAPTNPLTARVLANRTWMHLFGVGLVRTPGDFGVRSEPPTYPELLDELAASVIEQGWSWKGLQRRILSSATYQQASLDRPNAAAVDPDNQWLWKMNRRRLDLEATRDALHAVSNYLDDRLGGPSEQLFNGAFQARRTLYTYLDRQDPPGLMTVFDFPNASVTNPQRDTTTVSPQALYFMNGPLVETAARHVVPRLELTSAEDIPTKVNRVTELLFARSATSDDIAAAAEYLADSPDTERWFNYVHALLMTNEFVFVD